MSATSIAPSEALSALFEEWSRAEESSENQVWDLLKPIEEAFSRLDSLAAELAEADQTQAAARDEAEQRIQAADEHRQNLEHDLKLARDRVSDLEESLQQRTEELLEAQKDNNELAAQLQAVGNDLNGGGFPTPGDAPHADGGAFEIEEEPHDSGPEGGAEGEPVVPTSGVAARFAQLRRPGS